KGPITVGDNPVRFRLNKKHATVFVSNEMPGMNMGLRPVPAREVEPGLYEATLPFSMEGLWKIRVEANGQDAGGFSLQTRRAGVPYLPWVVLGIVAVILVVWRP